MNALERATKRAVAMIECLTVMKELAADIEVTGTDAQQALARKCLKIIGKFTGIMTDHTEREEPKEFLPFFAPPAPPPPNPEAKVWTHLAKQDARRARREAKAKERLLSQEGNRQ